MQLMLSEHFLLLKYCPLITVHCTAYFAFTGIYTTTTRTALSVVDLPATGTVPVDDEAVLENIVELFF